MNITFRLAWRNIWRHPRRTGLTLAAIAFAATLLIFMITLQLGSYDMLIDNNLKLLTGHFQVQQAGYLDKPKMRNGFNHAQQLAKQLRQLNDIKQLTSRSYGFSLLASEQRTYGIQIIGVETQYEGDLSMIPHRIQTGQFLSHNHAQEIVIGNSLARNLKVSVGDELTLLGSGYDGSIAAAVLTISGIFNSGMPEIDRGIAEIPFNTFQDIFNMNQSAHTLVGVVDNLDNLKQILPLIQAEINQVDFLTQTEKDNLVLLDWNILSPGLLQIIEADMINSWFLYGCLILIVTFSILNTFLMAVLERTREFGVMLALGAKPFFIGKLVMLESFLLTILGLMIGLSIGGSIAFYYHIYGFSYPGMAELGAQFGLSDLIFPKISVVSLVLGPTVIFVFTMIASLYPALRIRILKPVDAMNSI